MAGHLPGTGDRIADKLCMASALCKQLRVIALAHCQRIPPTASEIVTDFETGCACQILLNEDCVVYGTEMADESVDCPVFSGSDFCSKLNPTCVFFAW